MQTQSKQTNAIVAAIDAIPDFSPDGLLGVHLAGIRVAYQSANTYSFLSSPSPSSTYVTQEIVTLESVSRRRKKKQALMDKKAATAAASASTSVPIGASTTTAASLVAVLQSRPICGFYLAGKCTALPCNKEHRKPLASDAEFVTKFFNSRPKLTQTII